ncbi:MAG: GNAT family N-acetyltransferase [Oligoflexales bacterium]
MEILALTNRHYQEFLDLCEYLDELHRNLLPEDFQKPSHQPRTLESFIAWTKDPKTCLLGAFDNGGLVGFCYGVVQDLGQIPFYIPKKILFIEMLVVSADFQKRGIGQALLEHAETWSKERTIREIRLTVYHQNDGARTFYSRNGFEDFQLKVRKTLL